MAQLSFALESILQFTSKHILFPRLRRLYVDVADFIPSKVNPIRMPSLVWLFLTVTPSMKQVKLSVSFRPEEIDYSVDATLLKVLLGLFLRASPEIEELDTSVAPRSLEYFHAAALDRSHYQLPPLPQLRSLKINAELLEYFDFEWISHLPQLQTLQITGHRLINIVQYLKIDLPATAFPSLERIDLYGGCSLELFRVVWQPRITCRITKCKMRWDDLRASDEEIAAMLNIVASNAPMLASFKLFPRSRRTPLPMRLLGPLPLRVLEISTVIENEVDFEDNLDVIGGLWPKLEILRLPNVQIRYEKLLNLTRDLPNLKELTISLPVSPPVPGIDIPAHPPVKTRPKHQLHLFLRDREDDEPDLSDDELQNIGLVLAMSWPDTYFVGYIGRDEFGREEDLIRRSITENSALILESVKLRPSQFVNDASRMSPKVGHDSMSRKKEVRISPIFQVDNQKVQLFDVPGFDGFGTKDAEVLKLLAEALHKIVSEPVQGVLYFHQINEKILPRYSKQAFEICVKICGTDAMRNLMIVTNKWSGNLNQEDILEERRHRSDCFHEALRVGARLARRAGPGPESAESIIRAMFYLSPSQLLLQIKLQRGLPLIGTEAGRLLQMLIHSQLVQLQENEAELEEELKQARGDGDRHASQQIEGLKKNYELERKRLKEAMESLLVSPKPLHEAAVDMNPRPNFSFPALEETRIRRRIKSVDEFNHGENFQRIFNRLNSQKDKIGEIRRKLAAEWERSPAGTDLPESLWGLLERACEVHKGLGDLGTKPDDGTKYRELIQKQDMLDSELQKMDVSTVLFCLH
ncbi:50S ribosome-binding GTPase [Ceratobasidium sp. AG-Ba]|nr:50S ribosome-binding GTPase [Ceratobasidium sp. AG-Ba]